MEGETIHNEPFEVWPDMVADALLAADALEEIQQGLPFRLLGVDSDNGS